MPSSLEKALFYHEAYELAVKAKAEHPEWGYKRVATYIGKQLPIKVPPMTVYFWITGRSKPNVTRVRPRPALGYLVGVLVGDYTRSRKGKGLRVKDREFVEYYARKYEEVTGVRLNVRPDRKGCWHTRENAGWLKELWYSGLWRIFAYVYPLEFLKGLFDSEGFISPAIEWDRSALSSVTVGLAIGDREVAEYVERLLRKLGLEINRTYSPLQIREMDGQTFVFGECWKLSFKNWVKLLRFARLIGFREGKRRRRLKLLLRIRNLSPRKRLEEWTKRYVKVKGRWVERASNPCAGRIKIYVKNIN